MNISRITVKYRGNPRPATEVGGYIRAKSPFGDLPNHYLESPRRRTLLRRSPRLQSPGGVVQLAHFVLVFLITLILLSGCAASSGSTLSNVYASTNTLVPGSSGIGKPPGALEIHYALGKTAQVTANLQGPLNNTLISSQQDAGDHVLRFTGVITDAQALDGYKIA